MARANIKGKSLLSWMDYTAEEIYYLLDIALKVKEERRKGQAHSRLKGKSIALLFEKRSTRTRCAFETAIGEEAGHPVFLSTDDIQLGAKETIKDTARVLGRMFDAIQFRGYQQKTVEVLAAHSGVPVYNGLTDMYHPTQVLADIMTLIEIFSQVKGLKLCYLGDGRNNVANSLLLICAKLGLHISIISPATLQPQAQHVQICSDIAKASGSRIVITDKLEEVQGANAIYTDVWVSMGEENKKNERLACLKNYQVDANLMAKTQNRDSVFLHCLPAVCGQEVSEEVFESPASRVWDQAENRKHSIKAILLSSLGLE